MTALSRTMFSTRLRGELTTSGLSQADLAVRVGVSQQTVSKWLSGETQPRLKLVPALARALDMSVTDLSATLVDSNATGSLPAGAEEDRVVALTRRLRQLGPAQLARVEAYVHGLRDAPS